ncbi:hypothetical protein TrVFT333_006614 [Trichoderma virens FT-333]|nr:hypothetical protein TrVFT333_006614 [Trichoderma virens FT-333]
MHESGTDNDTRKKPLSPSSSPPLPTSSRRRSGRRQADNIKEFDRGINGSNRGQLWSPTKPKAQTLDQQPKPLSQAKPAQYKIGTEEGEAKAEADDLYVADPSVSQMIQQPDTRPISQEQLVAEVKGIYAGLVMVESKCIEVDNAQSADKGSHSPQQLTDEQWQALIALHRFQEQLFSDAADKQYYVAGTPLILAFVLFRLLGVSKRLSLSFLGNEKQRLRGYLNGHLATALPDTGSDAMFLNGEFARKLGLDIDSNVRNLVEVELADGSTTMTSGIVRDVHWKVGKTTVQCNFYVLEDLCADIILSNTYLFDMNIFSEQEKHFFDIDSEDHFKDYLFHFCNLRLVKKNHVASPSAFSPEMTQQELEQLEQWEKLEELHKRDENRDRIMRLPEDQQEKAAQDEKARQQCWEALRKERKAKWAAGSHTTKENVQNGGSLIVSHAREN